MTAEAKIARNSGVGTSAIAMAIRKKEQTVSVESFEQRPLNRDAVHRRLIAIRCSVRSRWETRRIKNRSPQDDSKGGNAHNYEGSFYHIVITWVLFLVFFLLTGAL